MWGSRFLQFRKIVTSSPALQLGGSFGPYNTTVSFITNWWLKSMMSQVKYNVNLLLRWGYLTSPRELSPIYGLVHCIATHTRRHGQEDVQYQL